MIMTPGNINDEIYYGSMLRDDMELRMTTMGISRQRRHERQKRQNGTNREKTAQDGETKVKGGDDRLASGLPTSTTT
jgi:hypothetical protein